MQRPDWAPDDVSTETPSPARMYDALLGGSHNFAVDRIAADQAAALAQQADPQCRVAYVDIDPIAVTHARAILTGNPRAIALQGDLRTPDQVLANPQLRQFLDFDQPIAVLLIAVLHLLTDADNPAGAVATLRDACPPGSYLAISHLTSAQRPDNAAQLGAHAAKRTGVPIIFRSREQITAFFAGLTVIEPGIVGLHRWRPDTPEDTAEISGPALGLAGVGRKDQR